VARVPARQTAQPKHEVPSVELVRSPNGTINTGDNLDSARSLQRGCRWRMKPETWVLLVCTLQAEETQIESRRESVMSDWPGSEATVALELRAHEGMFRVWIATPEVELWRDFRAEPGARALLEKLCRIAEAQ